MIFMLKDSNINIRLLNKTMFGARKKPANPKAPLAERWQKFKYKMPGYPGYDKWMDRLAGSWEKGGKKEYVKTTSGFLSGFVGGTGIGPVTHELGGHALAAKILGKQVDYLRYATTPQGMPGFQIGISKTTPAEDVAIGLGGPISDVAVGLALLSATKHIKNPFARNFCRGAGIARVLSPAINTVHGEIVGFHQYDLSRVAEDVKMTLMQRFPELSTEISNVPKGLLVAGIISGLYLTAYGAHKYGPIAAQRFKERHKMNKELRTLRKQGTQFGTKFNLIPISNKRARELLERIQKAQAARTALH